MLMDEPTIETFPLVPAVAVRSLPAYERPLQSTAREIPLLNATPWIRTLGKLTIEVSTQGWRFPSPTDLANAPASTEEKPKSDPAPPRAKTRVKPPSDMVIFKDRLLYLLQ